MRVFERLTIQQVHLLKRYRKEHDKHGTKALAEKILNGEAIIIPTRATSWKGVAAELTNETGFKYTIAEVIDGKVEWGSGYIVEICE